MPNFISSIAYHEEEHKIHHTNNYFEKLLEYFSNNAEF
jgi:hypothetical protein